MLVNTLSELRHCLLFHRPIQLREGCGDTRRSAVEEENLVLHTIHGGPDEQDAAPRRCYAGIPTRVPGEGSCHPHKGCVAQGPTRRCAIEVDWRASASNASGATVSRLPRTSIASLPFGAWQFHFRLTTPTQSGESRNRARKSPAARGSICACSNRCPRSKPARTLL